MKISDFITKHCITMTAHPGVKAEQVPDWVKNQPGATAWTCVIHYQRRKLTVPYFMGSAHHEPPTLRGVLYCLCSDAWSAADSFEDFCANCGYDTDSRTAENLHKACLKTRKALERVFGDLYPEFMGCEED